MILDKLTNTFNKFYLREYRQIDQTFQKSIIDNFIGSEIVCLSFPKCGRTWLRVLLGKLFIEQFKLDDQKISPFLDSSFNKIDEIPSFFFTHDGSDYYREKKYNYRSKKIYRNKKIILLTRDIRDMAVSYFYHRRFRDGRFEGNITDFLRHPGFGISKILEFYDSWLFCYQNSCVQDILVIGYEDLYTDTLSQIKKILEFLNLETDSQFQLNAVKYSSFDKMQAREIKNEFFGIDALSSKNLVGNNNMKVRSGKIGSFADDMARNDLVFVEKQFEKYPELRNWLLKC